MGTRSVVGQKHQLKWAVLVVAAAPCLGITNIDPDFKYSWGENIGWMNWRDANDGVQGAELRGSYLCGYIWAENVGWIDLGDGTPANDTHYANADNTDFGVNVNTGTGELFGLAWGENIGWINFDTAAALGPFNQQARFDSAANRFRGYAWAENVGWINLDEPTYHVAVAGAQTVSIVQWRSVRTHSNVGDLAIVLNPTASGNGFSGPAVETRNGGIRRIEVDFNHPVTLAQPGDISVMGRTTSGGVMGAPNAYTPASVVMADADTLAIHFASLPDESCYTISIPATAIAEALSGDADVNLRALAADTNMTGEVSLGDQASTKSKTSPPQSAINNPQHDVNLTGGNINLGDASTVKNRITTPSKKALCP